MKIFFDRRYGVHTEDKVEAESLGINAADCCGYMPYKRCSLGRILPYREVTDQDVFLDAGSGMGRVVLQAALKYPFRRVIGVELSTRLHTIAVMNLAHNRQRFRCQDVTLVQSDVLDYNIPDDVTVVFLYNPFGGEIFEQFVQRLLDSVDRHPRVVRIIYVNPREEARLLATGRVTLIRSQRSWHSTPDRSRSNSIRLYLLSPAGDANPVSSSQGRSLDPRRRFR